MWDYATNTIQVPRQSDYPIIADVTQPLYKPLLLIDCHIHYSHLCLYTWLYYIYHVCLDTTMWPSMSGLDSTTQPCVPSPGGV